MLEGGASISTLRARRTGWGVLVLCAGVLLVSCRRMPPAGPDPREACVMAPLLVRIRTGDAETRYHAILALRRYDTADLRSRLRALLASEEPLTRGAAARVLVDLGEEDAAAVLIANLDRRHRTWAVTDAIHHLRALFGTDRGYDPNRGYRHQSEAQGRWWTWWTARGHERPAEDAWPDAEAHAARHGALVPRVAAYEAAPATGDAAAWEATRALWRAVGELAPSRDPEHVALVARAFGAMARRWPEEANLWNNHALALLNDGRHGEAESSYARALALAPDDAYLHNDAGILLEGLGRLTEAEAMYRAAIRLDPEDPTWRSNLGDVLAAQGRRAEAIRAYRAAERLDPTLWYYHRLLIGRLQGARARPPDACRLR